MVRQWHCQSLFFLGYRLPAPIGQRLVGMPVINQQFALLACEFPAAVNAIGEMLLGIELTIT